MLELRPNCERCDRDLPPDADARICSYECTFCAECAERVLENVCPNCGGGFVSRPIRPRAPGGPAPASETTRRAQRRRELKVHRGPGRRAGAEAPRRRAARPLGLLPRRRPALRIASTLASTSASVVDQLDTEIRMSRRRATSSRRASMSPRRCTRCSTRVGPVLVADPTSTWFSTTSFTTSNPSSRSRSANRRASAQQRSTSSATPSRPSSRSAAQIANPRARREDSGVKSAPPKLAPPLAGQVGRGVRHRGGVHLRVRAEREARVVRHVEPLVPVAAPGVGELDAVDELARCAGSRPPRGRTRRRRGPSHRAAGDRASPQVVAGARVHVAGLHADDRRPVRPSRAPRRARRRPWRRWRPRAPARSTPARGRAGGATGRRWRGAPPRPPPAPRGAPIRPRGSTSQPAREHVVPGRRQAHRVGRLCAGDEADRRRRGQAEELLQPAAGHVLGRERGR